MRIPQNFLQQLKDKCEIEDVISSYVALRRRGTSLTGLCPFHSEKTPSFTVFPATQSYYCFGCGAGGDAVSFIRAAEHLDYVDAVKLLAEKVGLELPEEEDNQPAFDRERIFRVNAEAARYFNLCLNGAQGQTALAYLKNRRLSDNTLRRFGIGYAPESWDGLIKHLTAKGFKREDLLMSRVASVGKTGGLYDYFRNRVMFPIIDVRGKVIAFGGRVMDDSQPKYLNSPDTPVFKKSNNLFALNFAKGDAAEGLILAEGYMDVIALHQAGFQNAVASLGTAITEQQARLIARYAKRAVIAYDADEAGQKATRRAIGFLNEVGVEVKVLSMTGAKDPDEFIKKNGADRFRLLLQKSENYIEFQLEKLRMGYDLEQADQRVKFLDDAIAVLADIQSPIEREVYAGKLAQENKISKEVVLSDLAKRLKRRYKKEEKILIGLGRNQPRDRSTVNPQKKEHLKAALAEERLLCILFFHPDYWNQLQKALLPEDFVTDFNREVYEVFCELLRDGVSLDTMQLGARFNQAEMGYIAGILAHMDTMIGSMEEAMDYCKVLHDAGSQISQREIGDFDPAALQEHIRKMGNQK